MKDIYPLYCKEFTCIAGACPDTCCAQWEIVIDEKYEKLYKSHPSQAAKDAVSAMYTDSDGDTCLRLKNGRCPMLNDENLCRLYIEMGKDALCDVCRIYPRFNKESEKINLCGISLSCPEAARLILSDESFGELNKKPHFESEEYNFVFKTFEAFRKLSIYGTLAYSLHFAESIQDEIDFGDISKAEEVLECAGVNLDAENTTPDALMEIVRFMQTLDILRESWKETLSMLTLHLEKASNDKEYGKKRELALLEISSYKEIKNIGVYYLYKYLPEAMEYTDIYTCVITAVACTEIICELCAMNKLQIGILEFANILEYAKDFSKEIEHNGDNMEKLLDVICLAKS